ncbi:hypothetical protein QWY31_01740 [Cytophagales bacterium LB-30]|uniref:Uncharacterized protein n=1 Tax=Shiella aurantiaca TaxID=3058365 RepID=A0ABT8F185_9BACT|nr:hypothetical protein [Shiella aurantiaca]MDN4164200.1 hypothetical protein [Shiella aurantiaca]
MNARLNERLTFIYPLIFALTAISTFSCKEKEVVELERLPISRCINGVSEIFDLGDIATFSLCEQNYDSIVWEVYESKGQTITNSTEDTLELVLDKRITYEIRVKAKQFNKDASIKDEYESDWHTLQFKGYNSYRPFPDFCYYGGFENLPVLIYNDELLMANLIGYKQDSGNLVGIHSVSSFKIEERFNGWINLSGGTLNSSEQLTQLENGFVYCVSFYLPDYTNSQLSFFDKNGNFVKKAEDEFTAIRGRILFKGKEYFWGNYQTQYNSPRVLIVDFPDTAYNNHSTILKGLPVEKLATLYQTDEGYVGHDGYQNLYYFDQDLNWVETKYLSGVYSSITYYPEQKYLGVLKKDDYYDENIIEIVDEKNSSTKRIQLQGRSGMFYLYGDNMFAVESGMGHERITKYSLDGEIIWQIIPYKMDNTMIGKLVFYKDYIMAVLVQNNCDPSDSHQTNFSLGFIDQDGNDAMGTF